MSNTYKCQRCGAEFSYEHLLIKNQLSQRTPMTCVASCQGLLVEKGKSGSNDGSKNSFYKIPEWVKDVDDLSEYLQLDPYEFNILKTLWVNIGERHSGTNQEREINKCIHYANKRKEKYERARVPKES